MSMSSSSFHFKNKSSSLIPYYHTKHHLFKKKPLVIDNTRYAYSRKRERKKKEKKREKKNE